MMSIVKACIALHDGYNMFVRKCSPWPLSKTMNYSRTGPLALSKR